MNRYPQLSFVERCRIAREALQRSGIEGNDVKILAVTPFFQTNPYQRMLYSDAMHSGFAVLPVSSLSELLEAELDNDIILHHHWVKDIFHKRSWKRGANKAAKKYLADIHAVKARGVPIVWTIHNVMAHQSYYPEAEKALRAGLADAADHIHIMNSETPDRCAPFYGLDKDKLFRVPHPSYKGVYANYVSREQARVSLGLSPSEKVFLLFGSLEKYKGIVQFVKQFDALAEKLGVEASLLVAGRDGKDGTVKEIRASLPSLKAKVHLLVERVREQDMQILFNAADVVVCAHAGGLNSGVIPTALTFERPVVAPKHLVNCIDGADALVSGYDHGDDAGLFLACKEALASAETAGISIGASEWAETYAPKRVSSSFFQALRARL